jgi:hypothetical protein
MLSKVNEHGRALSPEGTDAWVDEILAVGPDSQWFMTLRMNCSTSAALASSAAATLAAAT